MAAIPDFIKDFTAKFTLKIDLNPVVITDIETLKNESVPGAGQPNTQTTPQSQETDDYYIVPFRLLSAIVVTGLGFPVDYSQVNFQNKINLFNQTLYKNHSWNVENWIGLVKNSRFNEASTPPGVDAELWFDKKLKDNGDIIRGVQTNALNRCSVTLTTKWKQSHDKLTRTEFFEMLGKNVDNDLVRVIVTEIVEVYEVSLVWYGADSTAKKLSQEKSNQIEDKGLETLETEVKVKPEEIKKLLSQALGIEVKLDEEIITSIQSIITKNKELTARVQELLPAMEFQKNTIDKARERVMSLAKAIYGDKLTTEQTDLYLAASYEKLQAYEADMDKHFPGRRSSHEVNHGETPKRSEEIKRMPV